MAQQQNFNNIMSIASSAAAFSDDRLKDNIVVIAYTKHPDIKKYRWEWNAKAEKLGLHGDDQGYMCIGTRVDTDKSTFLRLKKN
jgi:hypothetical protein